MNLDNIIENEIIKYDKIIKLSNDLINVDYDIKYVIQNNINITNKIKYLIKDLNKIENMIIKMTNENKTKYITNYNGFINNLNEKNDEIQKLLKNKIKKQNLMKLRNKLNIKLNDILYCDI
jgi:hypothetical protein